jgi:hypothetical protein
MFSEEDVVYRYTREDALRDSVLVDITEMAKECGFCIPVALNFITYHRFVTEGKLDSLGIRAFLLDIYFRIQQGMGNTDRFILEDENQTVVHVHDGDEGEPVMTVYPLDEG